MGVVVATAVALVIWIVLWALGFGRTGDAFIIVVPLLTVLAGAGRVLRRSYDENQRAWRD